MIQPKFYLEIFFFDTKPFIKYVSGQTKATLHQHHQIIIIITYVSQLKAQDNNYVSVLCVSYHPNENKQIFIFFWFNLTH